MQTQQIACALLYGILGTSISLYWVHSQLTVPLGPSHALTCTNRHSDVHSGAFLGAFKLMQFHAGHLHCTKRLAKTTACYSSYWVHPQKAYLWPKSGALNALWPNINRWFWQAEVKQSQASCRSKGSDGGTPTAIAAPFEPCLRASDALALRGVIRGEGPLMPKPPLLALLEPNRFSVLTDVHSPLTPLCPLGPLQNIFQYTIKTHLTHFSDMLSFRSFHSFRSFPSGPPAFHFVDQERSCFLRNQWRPCHSQSWCCLQRFFS